MNVAKHWHGGGARYLPSLIALFIMNSFSERTPTSAVFSILCPDVWRFSIVDGESILQLELCAFAPFHINTIIFIFVMAFLAISDQYKTFFQTIFTKWPPAPILDVRNSLLIAYLAISYIYATLIYFLFLTK